jgi:anti-sigma regulatory factor (Ser/Thr protein kinase)
VSVDEIRLTLPRERRFHRIAHLVLGGLAVRLDLTFDTLEDLQVALAELLERYAGDADLQLVLRVYPDAIEARVGPFDGELLRDELDREEAVGLRRVLDTVVDDVRIDEHDGAHWVELRKAVASAGSRA